MSDRRVTIVTGASQGIGRSIAKAFAAVDDVVVLAARDTDNLEATAAEVQRLGGEPLVIGTDVTSEGSVRAMVEQVLDRYGRIDVLVNNSGVGGPSGRLWEIDPGDWMETFDVNVFGVFLVTRAVIPTMAERRSGCVITIGSISGKRPLYGRTSYSATKTALIGLTRTLAAEAGPEGIRVNLVSPGFVAGSRLDWVMNAQAESRGLTRAEVRAEFEAESPLGRLTEPQDIADTVVFLASDEARAITGADINVNSGVVTY